ncbi:AmmeMemoRadiSam system radical SAM enzyme [Methanolapillus ohkumae]|uniref:Radical SAM core domain-containing protein n=1 Tax=Methanolapillus ohkumae TaxID=3028298 RepID=A0AA96ZVR1_9EURY|nr:hypothetical protein MsAm2_09460 [Methanosarcinaceae archaeon Am2]
MNSSGVGPKPAMFFEPLPDNKVKCHLCSRRCLIFPGKTGFCRIRKNISGKLYSLNYGMVSSKAIDPVEKKPVYHFLPGTTTYSLGTIGCNFKCLHCQNWRISQVLFENKNNSDLDSDTGFLCYGPEKYDEEITPEEVIFRALFLESKSISFTYNEPTLWYEFIYDTAVLAKENGLYVILVTNGYMTPEALLKLAPFIDVYRVDIKAFNTNFYSKIAQADLEPVLLSAKKAKELRLHVEVVTLLIPGQNDDPREIKQMADWIFQNLGKETPVHLNAFHPDYRFTDVSHTPLSLLENSKKILNDAGLDYVYIGNIESKYRNTYCPDCKTLLIHRSYSLADFVNLKKDNGKHICEKCGREIYLFDP